jgi:formate dehydrogenase major subunit
LEENIVEKVLTVCPYCASGCKLYLLVEDGKVIGAEGADGYTNQGELCLKGYYGWDFINDTKILTPRLTTPMMRKNRNESLRPVSWEEAITFASENLTKIKDKYGSDSIYLTGSSRGPGNEVNYLMQKFARAVVGTNNIDCCARV